MCRSKKTVTFTKKCLILIMCKEKKAENPLRRPKPVRGLFFDPTKNKSVDLMLRLFVKEFWANSFLRRLNTNTISFTYKELKN